jgi:hypothetical protein
MGVGGGDIMCHTYNADRSNLVNAILDRLVEYVKDDQGWRIAYTRDTLVKYGVTYDDFNKFVAALRAYHAEDGRRHMDWVRNTRRQVWLACL